MSTLRKERCHDLEADAVVESGSHDELLWKDGKYRALLIVAHARVLNTLAL